ncbi:vacuolar protein sorting-associated protein 62-like [Branchiostoma floridae]|uniref:Vacuolar protein sorting-associated protein 62-like n=1 Tax=Branchiostoma floridae TaxID=7739 RepID=A0A9J7N9H6_BRAFL|nr:vacuolar protein sorting-associated protein 62-like [Branchiostoma floridae]
MNTMKTGKLCQSWSSQTPHVHGLKPSAYPTSGLEHDFCRNPDHQSGVWCFTTDPGERWEFCDVPACETTFACWSNPLQLSCPTGQTVFIDYAKYDRTATPVCPCRPCDADCRAANSLAVLKGACEGLQECTIRTSGYVSGDPCHVRHMYLEPTYRCVTVTPVRDDQLEDLVTKYAPKIWLAKGERYKPSSVDFHLENVAVHDGHKVYSSNASTLPTCSESCHMSTTGWRRSDEDSLPFFHGEEIGPTRQPPVYAIVRPINSITTDIFYWMFYPYNGPDPACPGLWSLWGTCMGGMRGVLRHVGDWEHMTLRLVGGHPRSIFINPAYKHEGTYNWDPASRTYRKGAVAVQTEGTHPILYSAADSHNLWATPGDHYYKRRLIPDSHILDITSNGTAWDTWKNVTFTKYLPDGGYTGSWTWLNYKGRWGDRKVTTVNCLFADSAC